MKGTLRSPLSRRQFLQVAGSAVTAVSVVPGHVLGANGQTPPSNRLNIASIGAGGMAAGDIDSVSRTNNIVALCDVDSARGGKTFEKYASAKRYQDFRKMFDEMEKNIDAVIVATPDHTHAVAAMAAMKRKKHVYCEKPLAHSVQEVRALMKAAKESGVVTQLGNQGHSFESIRNFCEWIWDGAIGKVHTIHAGCRAVNSGLDQLAQVKTERPAVPAGLNWDLWLGPAQFRPYHPSYLPGRWRGWVPFGNGTVGDWMCHVVDPVFWAFDLGAPTSIQAEVPDDNPAAQGDAYPKGEIITYQFPGNAKRGPIQLKWYSGTQRIPRPPELEKDEKDIETGAVVMGDKGTIVYGSHGANQVRLIPEARNEAYKRPAKTLTRVREHHADWLDAIKEGRKAGSDFSYGGPLTEVALLGIVAIKNPGQKLEWNGAAGQFTNLKAANALLQTQPRKGWELPA
jgi:predicted dehydrogenase